jgi:hypothetical protein
MESCERLSFSQLLALPFQGKANRGSGTIIKETSSFPRLRSSSLPFPRLQFEHYRFRDFDYRFRDFSSTITVCET